ncbi:MAG: M56 family metallopeptidase, partial [Eubacteriales bacterium]
MQQETDANTIAPSTYLPVQQQSLQVIQTENTQTAPQNSFTLNIYDALAFAWLVGMLLAAMRTAVLAARVTKVIKSKSVPAPADIEESYASCLRELGIKKRLPLLITQNLLSPALVVSVRPKILLPCSFVKQATNEQMRLALLHELVHYRHRDHWVCMLLRVLSVVYWFNPVLWMAEKEITADMETACDNRIVRSMQKEKKAFYANTILSMFSARAEAPFVLGLALPGTKQIAEKRIRGIYMKSKTKKGARLAAILLAMMLLVTCFTTACQPAKAMEAVPSPATS